MGKAVVLDSGMTQPSHVEDQHNDGEVEEKRTEGIPAPGTQMTGAQAIIKTLEALGVTDVFGLPGGAILPTYDPLLASRRINHILVRHEQGAGHAAQGYAQATGRTGVCIATSGPGATNLVTPLADAHMDSVPIVAVTGQVASQTIGRDAFQEADIVGITLPITKHSYLVTSAEGIPQTIAEAFYLARTGRPGPVLVDITKDAQQKMMTWSWPPTMDIEGYHPEIHERSAEVYRSQIHEAAKLIAKARRPVLYVGGGVIKADAAAQLFDFADSTHIPVVTTLTALGAFPDSHPQHLGMPGMHGSVAAVTALQKSDLLIALGTRFDDRVTGVLDGFAPEALVVHVDIDPAEISKNRHADIAVIGSVKNIIPALQREYEKVRIPTSEQRLKPWWTFLEEIRHDYPLGYPEPLDGLLAPQRVIERIGALSGPESIVVSGVGQHQMWSAQFIRHEHPRHWINSGGLGTMGYAVPAAMGAKIGAAGQTVWAVDGDGCFQMTNQELATCVINNIAIKVAIINNSSLGMVRQWQTLFYDGRYSNTELNTGHNSVRVPDFVKLAEAYGAVGLRCEDKATLDETIGKALEINDRPVIVDFVVSKDSMVWPMVPSGVSNDKIQIARDLTPRWERDEK